MVVVPQPQVHLGQRGGGGVGEGRALVARPDRAGGVGGEADGVGRRGRGAGGVGGRHGVAGGVERDVVEDEARLKAGVLGAGEGERDGPAREGRHVERLAHVAGVLVQVRVGGQRRRVDLGRQLVVRGGRRRLGGVDVQPEGEGGGRAPGGDRDALGERVGVGAADPAQPGEGGAAVGALTGAAGDHAGGGLRPRRDAALEASVDDDLGGCAGGRGRAGVRGRCGRRGRGPCGRSGSGGGRGCRGSGGERQGGQRGERECARGEGLAGRGSHTWLLCGGRFSGLLGCCPSRCGCAGGRCATAAGSVTDLTRPCHKGSAKGRPALTGPPRPPPARRRRVGGAKQARRRGA